MGRSSNHTDCWNLQSNASILRGRDGTTLNGNQWSFIRLLLNNTYDIINRPIRVEFDTLDITGQCGVNVYQSISHNTILTSNKHYKFIISDKIQVYVDNVAQTPQTYDPTSHFQFQFVLRESSSKLIFRNVIVY